MNPEIDPNLTTAAAEPAGKPSGRRLRPVRTVRETEHAADKASAAPSVLPPFLHTADRPTTFAFDLLIASLPVLGARVWFYGWRTLTVAVIAVLSCLLFDALFSLVVGKDLRMLLSDLDFSVTGLLVALTVSPNVPLWVPAVLAAFASAIFKGLLGLRTDAVRSYPLNPALAAFALLLLLWNQLDLFGAIPGKHAALFSFAPDPSVFGLGNPILTSLRGGALPSVSPVSVLFGNAEGAAPTLLILFAFAYLLIRRTVSWQAPCAMLFTCVLFSALVPRTPLVTDVILLQSVLFEITSGSLLVCAVFGTADRVTMPYTGTGKLFFGIAAGAATMLLRYFTGIVNCAPLGILIADLLTPLLNRLTRPRPFGIRSDE